MRQRSGSIAAAFIDAFADGLAAAAAVLTQPKHLNGQKLVQDIPDSARAAKLKVLISLENERKSC